MTQAEHGDRLRGPLTAQLLIDLTTNPLDPGYAEAAARRGGARAPWRWPQQAAVAVGCALVGFALVVAYVHTHRGAPQAAKVHDQLVSRVREQQRSVSSLAATAARLNDQIAEIREQALGAVDAGFGGVDRALALAGDTAVSGPGVEVVLTEPARATPTASGRAGTGALAQGNILTDRDVRSVVNELWHDGAEAISVNNLRLTPDSAIRFAGEAVLVDFQPITSPYTIRAIGAPDDLVTAFAQSEVASRYHTLVSADGVGFSFAEKKKLSLPAGTSVAPRYASAATPSPTATASRPSASSGSGQRTPVSSATPSNSGSSR
jgi:uncharacterized protein YlxW (UPF0749 family)